MMVGFALAGRWVRAGRTKATLLASLAVACVGAVLFATAQELPALYAALGLLPAGTGLVLLAVARRGRATG